MPPRKENKKLTKKQKLQLVEKGFEYYVARKEDCICLSLIEANDLDKAWEGSGYGCATDFVISLLPELKKYDPQKRYGELETFWFPIRERKPRIKIFNSLIKEYGGKK